jgi:hypothetical protein
MDEQGWRREQRQPGFAATLTTGVVA